MIITLEKYLTSNGRHPEALKEWDGSFGKNAIKTIATFSEFASMANLEIKDVTSGFRYPNLNKKVGGSSQSKHLFAQAIDVEDNDMRFGKWFMSNIGLLRSRGCAIESLTVTHAGASKWLHFQIQLPHSGNVVFCP